jgi:5-methylcytosine-specific restriction endonuclease McrA
MWIKATRKRVRPAKPARAQLDWDKGVCTMATRFGKDPNMKKSNHAELERLNLERKQKLAAAAVKFNQKKTAQAPQDANSK